MLEISHRLKIYSYLPIIDLLKVAKIRKEDRENIETSKIVDQNKILKVKLL